MTSNDPASIKSIIEILLSKKGCPWDREQTHQTLAKHLREEAAEVLDAVAKHDPSIPSSEAHLCEELGDLWLQVVFHACLADQRKAFDLHDVEAMVVEKLLRRHPHVFGQVIAKNSDQVLENWQAIKEKEKGNVQRDGLLENIPQNLSSMDVAMEIGHICAKVGFDWADIDGVMEKVREEIIELKDEVEPIRLEEEFGDVIFSLLQWARHKKIDPDLALRRQMERFKQRFKYVEECAIKMGGWENCSIEQMETAWQKGKTASNSYNRTQ